MGAAQIAMLAAQLGPQVWQFVQGVKQMKEGKALAANLQDPVMPIPQSASELVGMARQNAASRMMSGQGNLEARIDRQVANATSDAVRGATSSQDLLGAVQGINDRAMGQENEVAFQAANDYQRRQGELRGALQFMSGLEQQKWTNDVLNKFLRDSAAASALQNAGMRNKYEGFKGGMGALGSFAGNNMASINKMFSGGSPNMGEVGASAIGSAGAGTASDFSTPEPQPQQMQNLGQMIGQEQYGADWARFVSSLGFQANPSFNF